MVRASEGIILRFAENSGADFGVEEKSPDLENRGSLTGARFLGLVNGIFLSRSMKALLVVSLSAALLMVSVLLSPASSKEESDRFSRRRLNDGIVVDAPDAWRWIRDGIHIDNVKRLMGEPKNVEPRLSQDPNSLQTITYESDVKGAEHRLSFYNDGLLCSCSWYQGIPAASGVAAPVPAIEDGLVVNGPRIVPIKWKGEAERGFQVEVEIQHPDGKWASSRTYFTSNHAVAHLHTGDNPGRWRVRALAAEGAGVWSPQVGFVCGRE